MPRFRDSVIQVLQRGGWFDGRSIDLAPVEDALRKLGYPLFPAVQIFLAEFGELSFETRDPRPRVARNFHFRPLDVSGKSWILGPYTRRAGKPLCVIGAASDDYLLLSMDPAGVVYGGYDDDLVILGRSPDDAIDALCDDRPGLPVP